MDSQLDALGVKYQNYDAANIQGTQIDQINTAITNGANLLIVNIVETSSPDAAQKAVEAAQGAGIPIIFFNREVADEVVNSCLLYTSHLRLRGSRRRDDDAPAAHQRAGV